MPFPDLPDRLNTVRRHIEEAVRRGGHGQTVTIVGVTKSHGPDAVLAAWNAGLTDVGENRVQEAISKMDAVSVPVRWHLIGHLQTNKVKAIPRFSLFHALDSARLADAVNELGTSSGTPIDSLVQVNVIGEHSKGGFSPSELPGEAERLRGMSGLRVRGIMTMAPLDADAATLRVIFGAARHGREVLADAGHPATELSMGMSDDYEIAVEEGATYVRLGTVLFGARSA